MKRIYMCLVAGMAIGIGGAAAHAASFVIPGTASIWLAGQPSGTSDSGYFGSDTTPANSSVLVSVTGGQILTFSASGLTSVDGLCFAGPDGGCYSDQSGDSPAPVSGDYNGPADALIGVFLNSGAGPIPISNVGGYLEPTGFVAGLDYQASSNANESLSAYSPSLNQVFFIGDGLTGTGTGSVQQFTVPTGADSLFLAVGDSVGGSANNLGSLNVTVSGITASPIPEPSTLTLLGSGLVGLAGLVRRKLASRA